MAKQNLNTGIKNIRQKKWLLTLEIVARIKTQFSDDFYIFATDTQTTCF